MKQKIDFNLCGNCEYRWKGMAGITCMLLKDNNKISEEMKKICPLIKQEILDKSFNENLI